MTPWASDVAQEKGFGWLGKSKVLNTIEVATQAYKLPPQSAGDSYTNNFLPALPIRP